MSILERIRPFCTRKVIVYCACVFMLTAVVGHSAYSSTPFPGSHIIAEKSSDGFFDRLASKPKADVPKPIKKPKTQKMLASIDCMAKNIFFEARGTSIAEKVRVANVTINRTKNSNFPDDICQVVYQPKQFSWTWILPIKKREITYYTGHDGEAEAWKLSRAVAEAAVLGELKDNTGGALFYHCKRMKRYPQWAKVDRITVKSDWHIYYR